MFKKILFGFGFLVILGALFLASVLLPPHLQIREITPQLPTKAELEDLIGVDSGPVKLSYFITSSQDVGRGSLAHTTFVVEWADGNIFLIDLGMDAAGAVKFGELIQKLGDAETAVSHGTVPSLMGQQIERVSGLGFTHLHVDHVQGIQAVCESKASDTKRLIALHTSDQFGIHNLHTADQSELLKNSACVQQIELADSVHSSLQFPGLGIYPLGGHTPGSTLFAIPIENKLWLLSGDITNTKKDLVENNAKGLIYSYVIVPENVKRQEQLRVWLAALDAQRNISVVVSHDAKALIKSGVSKWAPPKNNER